MTRPRLGIVGAVSRATTEQFYKRIVEQCSLWTGDAPDIVIRELTAPGDWERAFVAETHPPPRLVDEVKVGLRHALTELRLVGAAAVATPSNRLQPLMGPAALELDLPNLDPREATLRTYRGSGRRRPLLLGTVGTVCGGVYDGIAREHAIGVVYPGADALGQLSAALLSVARRQGKAALRPAVKACLHSRQGQFDSVILASGELSSLSRMRMGVRVVDSLTCGVEMASRFAMCGGRVQGSVRRDRALGGNSA